MRASHRRATTVASVALIALAAVGLASRSGDDDARAPTDPAEVAVDVTENETAPPRKASLAAPTDGAASRLLPVIVEPSTRLRDGQVITISGSGFTPHATLGAVLCSAGAAGGGGVAFCELAHYDNFPATAEGTFADDYILRRFITTPSEGQVDCASSTDRCLLAVGNIQDYDESGGSFISYEGAPEPPPPALVVSPSQGLVDGQVVSVTGTGVRAAPDGWLRQCPAGRLDESSCRRLEAQQAGPAVGGQLSVTVTVARTLATGGEPVDCAAPPGCVIATTQYAGRLATVPIGLVVAEAPGTAPSTTAAAPPTTSTSTAVPPTSTTEAPEPSTTSSTTSSPTGTRVPAAPGRP